jgi:hypothetical protein
MGGHVTELETQAKAVVAAVQAKEPTDAITKAAKTATTTASPANGGTDPDVESQVVAVLAADPPTWQFVVVAFAILAAGLLAGYGLWQGIKPSDFMPSSNYAVYAGLFIMALAIERVLEPFAAYVVPSTTVKKAQAKATAAKVTRAKAAVPAVPAAALTGAGTETVAAVAEAHTKAAAAVSTAQSEAAVATKEHHLSQANRAVLMWAIASALAMLVCASVGVFLLRSVETPAPTATAASTLVKLAGGTTPKPSPDNPPNRWVDLLVTGLVVGAGTKPLHDLITNIQSSAGSSKASSSS